MRAEIDFQSKLFQSHHVLESHLFGEDSQVGLPQMTVEQGDYAIKHFYNLETWVETNIHLH